MKLHLFVVINNLQCHYNAANCLPNPHNKRPIAHSCRRDTFCEFKVWSVSWWRHQMETFSSLLAICARNSPVPGEFPAQRPVTRSFDVFFDLRLNKRLSKQPWGWWLETPSWSLWRQCNVDCIIMAADCSYMYMWTGRKCKVWIIRNWQIALDHLSVQLYLKYV